MVSTKLRDPQAAAEVILNHNHTLLREGDLKGNKGKGASAGKSGSLAGERCREADTYTHRIVAGRKEVRDLKNAWCWHEFREIPKHLRTTRFRDSAEEAT